MAATLSIAYTATPLAAGTKLLIECTRQVSAGINFLPRSEYKTVTVTAAAAASPANILTAYTAIFGALVAGQKIFVRCTPIKSNGQKGSPQYGSIVIS